MMCLHYHFTNNRQQTVQDVLDDIRTSRFVYQIFGVSTEELSKASRNLQIWDEIKDKIVVFDMIHQVKFKLYESNNVIYKVSLDFSFHEYVKNHL